MDKKQIIEEQMHYLEELIQKVYRTMYPEEDHFQRLAWLTQQGTIESLFDRYPKCVITAEVGKRILFPICNRAGIHDPEVIKFSMDLNLDPASTIRFFPACLQCREMNCPLSILPKEPGS